jgi:hypothetical protein
MLPVKVIPFVTEFYKQFLQNDTDIKSEAGLAVAEQLKKLTEGGLCSDDLFICDTAVLKWLPIYPTLIGMMFKHLLIMSVFGMQGVINIVNTGYLKSQWRFCLPARPPTRPPAFTETLQ